MASIPYLEIIVLALSSLLFCYAWWRQNKKSSLPTNFPVVGTLPAVLQNLHQTHNYVTAILKESGGTIMLPGPLFGNMDMLVTSDPANIRHILNTNFSNYGKGEEFNEIFDILGDGIVNSDSSLWESLRKTFMPILNHPKFLKFAAKTSLDGVVKVVVPVLDHACQLGTTVDLQQVMRSLTFDSMCRVICGQDSASTTLHLGLPFQELQNAFADAEEATFYRHFLPGKVWKLQRWLRVGKEKQLRKARKAIEMFVAQCVSLKQEELKAKKLAAQEESLDILTCYMKTCQGESSSDKLLKDNMLNLVFAAKETTNASLTWLFWLLATNPSEEKKIHQEIIENLHIERDEHQKISSLCDPDELQKLVYLHGAICESLRLFPPIPVQHKCSIKPEVLPSGHKVGRNTRILPFFYGMGRMETIWGKDCMEFKPGRWITETGGIKYEPPYKFTAFNLGPRTCLGKNLSMIQMKAVVATMVLNYSFQVVGGSLVSPSPSVLLHMKGGLKVKVTKKGV